MTHRIATLLLLCCLVIVAQTSPGHLRADDKTAPTPTWKATGSKPKPYDPKVARPRACSKPVRHCATPGSPSTAYMLQPVTCYKTVIDTIYERAQVTVPRTVYETVYVDEPIPDRPSGGCQ